MSVKAPRSRGTRAVGAMTETSRAKDAPKTAGAATAVAAGTGPETSGIGEVTEGPRTEASWTSVGVALPVLMGQVVGAGATRAALVTGATAEAATETAFASKVIMGAGADTDDELSSDASKFSTTSRTGRSLSYSDAASDRATTWTSTLPQSSYAESKTITGKRMGAGAI